MVLHSVDLDGSDTVEHLAEVPGPAETSRSLSQIIGLPAANRPAPWTAPGSILSASGQPPCDRVGVSSLSRSIASASDGPNILSMKEWTMSRAE
ncbi:hypothetical protein GCM10027053_43540 [Intrasporangium mesophilum]